MARLPPILLFCLLLLSPAAAQAKVLKIATAAPEGTSWMKEMRAGAEEIARRTEGRVKFRFYPGGVMGNDASVLRKIRIGQLHGGAVTGGGLAAIHPDAHVYSLPFFFRSHAEVDYVRARMDPKLHAALAERGFIALGLAEGGFAYLMSRRPLRKRGDVKGRKVWAPQGDRISHAGFKAIGVAAIPLPLIDVLTGLQTGLIDTIASSPVGAIALQWHTRVKFLTDAPLAYIYGGLVLKRAAFEQLPAPDRAVVRAVMAAVFARLDTRTRHDNERAREALRNQGIEFVTPATEGWEEMRRAVSDAMDALARKGVFSNASLAELRGHLESYRRAHPAAQ